MPERLPGMQSALLKLFCVGIWLPPCTARIVGSHPSSLKTASGTRPRFESVNFDTEPLELYNDRGSWPADNPKNGTPWYRMKKVSEQGESTHRHFGGLTATGNFADDILRAHNVVRQRAGLVSLSWSSALESMARARVQKLAGEGCFIRHSPLHQRWEEAGFQYVGENLYKVINMAPTGVDVVDAWYAELEDYNYGSVGATCTKQRCAGRSSPPCMLGHFTQVMWAKTTDLGCAIEECPNQEQRTFVSVCNYGPGGNIVGNVPFSAACSRGLGLSNQACDEVLHDQAGSGYGVHSAASWGRSLARGTLVGSAAVSAAWTSS
mmetsp:Transcript_73274/g.212231  ORF Transcript_73274/g.212231 Transcript_73274/m.212231 type:complete len:321 (-) Transcript_73274:5-967(-)